MTQARAPHYVAALILAATPVFIWGLWYLWLGFDYWFTLAAVVLSAAGFHAIVTGRVGPLRAAATALASFTLVVFVMIGPPGPTNGQNALPVQALFVTALIAGLAWWPTRPLGANPPEGRVDYQV